MGGILSDILGDHKEENAAKEQMELLMKLADAKLDSFQAKLDRMFVEKEAMAKHSVPGRRALRYERSVRVDTSTTPGNDVDKAINAFFGEGEGALEGFKHVVKGALKFFLGNFAAGESYDEKFFVCIKHNAIIRVDMMSYRYNFKNESVISTHKNLLAYILCTSVVDHKDVTPDEIIYLASEFAGDKTEEYEAYLLGLIKVWKLLEQRDEQRKVGGFSLPPAGNYRQVSYVESM